MGLVNMLRANVFTPSTTAFLLPPTIPWPVVEVTHGTLVHEVRGADG